MNVDEPKLSPFDIANNIFEKKGHLSPEQLKHSKYAPFMVNRVLSNSPDTLFFAQEMNANYQLSPHMQYDFYYFGIDKKKRFGKWQKKSKGEQEKIDLIKQIYDYSELRAREVLPLLDQLDVWDDMRNSLDKGGAAKRKKRARKAKSK